MKEYVGKKILYRKGIGTSVYQGNCESISPNKKFIKINGRWENCNDIIVEDVLAAMEIWEMLGR